MTPHEQALARIEEKILVAEANFHDISAWQTHKAVLELHKGRLEFVYVRPEPNPSTLCMECHKEFPCPTADLIIKGVLGE